MDSSYRLTNNEGGKRITVTVSFTDGIGTEEAVTSQPTAAVREAVTPRSPPPPPVLTVAFDLASYSTTEGGDPVTLRVALNRTSNQDLTIPITVMPQGATEADDYTVSGLTDGALSFAPEDLSKTFMIVANEDTDSDNETIELGFGTLPEGVSKGEMATATLTITDDETPNNPPKGQPRITGTARVGQTLTAVTTDIQDADGLGDFAYQWKADETNIAEAMDSSYRLTNNEGGKRITVTVSFTDGIGTEEAVTSQPTAAVREAVTPRSPPPPPVLTVAFDLASYSTTEGGDPVTLRVALNRTLQPGPHDSNYGDAARRDGSG